MIPSRDHTPHKELQKINNSETIHSERLVIEDLANKTLTARHKDSHPQRVKSKEGGIR
jgi:hypothetical protein